MTRSLFILAMAGCVLAAHYPGSVLPPAGETYPELPWAYREIASIASVADADIYAAAEATEDRFKLLAPQYRIIHLATHAVVNDSEPANSKLVFNREYGSSEDGLLHAYEIYGLDLHADLVVLGACRSGTGKLIKGEGIVGLTHAFLHAGCESVVMSLWPIDDKATAGLMTDFYTRLGKNYSVNEALREAKLSMITGDDPVLANPYYWAGLTSVGPTVFLHDQH